MPSRTRLTASTAKRGKEPEAGYSIDTDDDPSQLASRRFGLLAVRNRDGPRRPANHPLCSLPGRGRPPNEQGRDTGQGLCYEDPIHAIAGSVVHLRVTSVAKRIEGLGQIGVSLLLGATNPEI